MSASLESQEAIRERVLRAYALFDEALVLHQRGDLDSARSLYEQSLVEFPVFAEALCNLGVLHDTRKDYAQAKICFERAKAADPEFAGSYASLGKLYVTLEDAPNAIAELSRAVELNPSDAVSHYNLALAFHLNQEFEEAIRSFQHALGIRPDFAEVYCSQGWTLEILDRTNEAIASFNRALELRPDYHEALWKRALCWLTMGEFEKGWPEYERRFRDPRRGSDRCLAEPRFRGEPIAGKRILVHEEQGLGDAIAMARFLPLLKARGAHVIVECYKPLTRLFQELDCIDEIVPYGSPLPHFDTYVPIMSLPGALGIQFSDLPCGVPYFTGRSAPNPALESLPRDGIRVGLCWTSGAIGRKGRTVPLADFASVLELQGFTFVALQKDATTEIEALPPHLRVFDVGSKDRDFADAAASIAAMDLVISVDTAISHLAGAMGKPVWITLTPDSYWMYTRGIGTPWYPTAKLFRRQRYAGVPGLMAALREALMQFRAER